MDGILLYCQPSGSHDIVVVAYAFANTVGFSDAMVGQIFPSVSFSTSSRKTIPWRNMILVVGDEPSIDASCKLKKQQHQKLLNGGQQLGMMSGDKGL